MRKRIISLLGAFSVVLPTVLAQIPAPGFDFHLFNEKAAEATSPALNGQTDPDQPTCVKKSPTLFVMDSGTGTEKVTRLTNYLRNTGSTSYTYNEWGFVDKVNNRTDYSTDEYNYRYAWERPGIWKTCQNTGDGSSVIRTFHSNGSVATNTTVDVYGDTISTYGYNEKGELISGSKYRNKEVEQVYFAPTKQWMYSSFPNLVVTVNPAENSYKQYRYSYDYQTQTATLRSTQERWFTPDGKQIGIFYENFSYGQLISASGVRPTFEPGKITLTSYTLAEDKVNYITIQKTVLSDNWYDMDVYSPGAQAYRKIFKVTDGQEMLTEDVNLEWINESIRKTTYLVSESYPTPYVYFQKYRDGYLSRVFYNEKNGNYGYSLIDGSSLEVRMGVTGYVADRYYEYFDASDQLLWTIKNYNEVYWSQLNPDTNEWIPCTGKITVFTSDQGEIEITFDEQNRMKESITTQSDGVFHTLYTYNADGYEYSQFKKSDTGDSEVLWMHYNKTVADGITTVVSESYEGTGSIVYAYKDVFNYNTDVYTTYSWIQNEWQVSQNYGMTTLEYLPDGINYAVTRREMNGDVAVNYLKIIGPVKQTENNVTETYNWDRDTNSWEPATKREVTYVMNGMDPSDLVVFYYEPVNPEENLYDYFHPADNARNQVFIYGSTSNSVNKEYNWNRDTKQWDLVYFAERSFKLTSEGGKKTVVFREPNNDFTITCVISEDNLLLNYTWTTDQGVVFSQSDFDYDSEGNLISKKIVSDTGITMAFYTYSEIEILSGLDAITTEPGLRINGTTVEADGRIEVFSVTGILVAAGDNAVDTGSLAPGVYIVRTANGTLKIAVK